MMKPKKVCPNDYEHEAWAKGQLLLGIDELLPGCRFLPDGIPGLFDSCDLRILVV